jgi:hypothetical protein
MLIFIILGEYLGNQYINKVLKIELKQILGRQLKALLYRENKKTFPMIKEFKFLLYL